MRSSGADRLVVVAMVFGFLGVMLGAFGAHLLEARLAATGREGVWDTAVLYHLVHAVAILVLAGRGLRLAGWVMVGGVIVFSGSLYLLAGLDLSVLGAITPIGGLLLLVGWAMGAAGVIRGQSHEVTR